MALSANPMSHQVTGRLIRAADIESVVTLMRAIGVHFAGSKADVVLHAVASDAVRRPRYVTVFVVEHERRLGGVVIAFSERSAYWRKFSVWHPFAAARMAAHRARRKLERWRKRPVAAPTAAQPIDDVAHNMWLDDSRDIAKVMFVGVDPQIRGAGLGHALYRGFFRDLAARGYRYCDAQVSTGNTAAIALHRKFPFEFFDVPGGYFARLDLTAGLT